MTELGCAGLSVDSLTQMSLLPVKSGKHFSESSSLHCFKWELADSRPPTGFGRLGGAFILRRPRDLNENQTPATAVLPQSSSWAPPGRVRGHDVMSMGEVFHAGQGFRASLLWPSSLPGQSLPSCTASAYEPPSPR